MPRFCLVNPRVKYSDFFAHIYGYIIWYVRMYIYAKRKFFLFFVLFCCVVYYFYVTLRRFLVFVCHFFILLIVASLLRNDKHN